MGVGLPGMSTPYRMAQGYRGMPLARCGHRTRLCIRELGVGELLRQNYEQHLLKLDKWVAHRDNVTLDDLSDEH